MEKFEEHGVLANTEDHRVITAALVWKMMRLCASSATTKTVKFCTFVLKVRKLRGGGLTRSIKKHTTKDEATRALKARVIKNLIGEDDFTNLTTTTFPWAPPAPPKRFKVP